MIIHDLKEHHIKLLDAIYEFKGVVTPKEKIKLLEDLIPDYQCALQDHGDEENQTSLELILMDTVFHAYDENPILKYRDPPESE